jgi:hypothetical protein
MCVVREKGRGAHEGTKTRKKSGGNWLRALVRGSRGREMNCAIGRRVR